MGRLNDRFTLSFVCVPKETTLVQGLLRRGMRGVVVCVEDMDFVLLVYFLLFNAFPLFFFPTCTLFNLHF